MDIYSKQLKYNICVMMIIQSPSIDEPYIYKMDSLSFSLSLFLSQLNSTQLNSTQTIADEESWTSSKFVFNSFLTSSMFS